VRPKKKVMLIDANQDSWSFLATVFRTHGFAVTSVEPDLVVTRVADAKTPEGVPVLIYTESRAEFLACVKRMTKSKRGPAKGSKRVATVAA